MQPYSIATGPVRRIKKLNERLISGSYESALDDRVWGLAAKRTTPGDDQSRWDVVLWSSRPGVLMAGVDQTGPSIYPSNRPILAKLPVELIEADER